MPCGRNKSASRREENGPVQANEKRVMVIRRVHPAPGPAPGQLTGRIPEDLPGTTGAVQGSFSLFSLDGTGKRKNLRTRPPSHA
jgi:hypothetical protein